MNDPTKPIASIKPQLLSSSPIPIDNTLVDDPVALVDDPKSLVGSQTTQIVELGTASQSSAPTASIHRVR